MSNWVNSSRRRAATIEACPSCGASNHDGKVSVKVDGGEPVYIRCHSCGHSEYVGPRTRRRTPPRLIAPNRAPADPPPPPAPWPEAPSSKRACNLAIALCAVYPADLVAAVFALYGVVRDANGATLFPYASNTNDGVAGVKCVLYEGLKRNKDRLPYFVVPPDRRVGFFRPKDLPMGAPVAAFESEKTALVWTLQNMVSGRFDAPVGVATGGASNTPALEALAAYAGQIDAWPDNDRAGSAWAAALVRAAGKRVRVVPPPPTWPAGWDFADAVLEPQQPTAPLEAQPAEPSIAPDEAERLLLAAGWQIDDGGGDEDEAWRCARRDEVRPILEQSYAHTLADPAKADRMRRVIAWHIANSPIWLPDAIKNRMKRDDFDAIAAAALGNNDPAPF